MSKWRVDLSQGRKQLTRWYHDADDAATEAAEQEKQGWTVDQVEEVKFMFPADEEPEDADYYPFDLRVTNDGKVWTIEAKFKRWDDAVSCMQEKSKYDHRQMMVHRNPKESEVL